MVGLNNGTNMKLQNYTSFFHDGSIFEIAQHDNKMIIFMESAEMDEEDIIDDAILTKFDRIRGKLHMEGIKHIKENGEPYLGVFKMKNQDAEIFHFAFSKNQIELQIIWNSLPPQMKEHFSTVEIEAEKIWWENIPDLSDSKEIKI